MPCLFFNLYSELDMTSIKNNWENSPSKNTPLSAERLNNLEENASRGADLADSVSPLGSNLLTAETALAARTFIGAGTSNLTIGTTATTAKAGNYAPTLAEIPSLPTSKINNGVFNIAQIPTGTTATTVSLGNHTHANATTTVAGFMSGVDKTKLDGITASTANPIVAGTATAGTSTDYARADHVHPTQNNVAVADMLKQGRIFKITGGAIGQGDNSFNGNQNITIDVVIAPATTTTVGGVLKATGVEDSSGEDLQALKTTLNELLANLREAGIMY